MHKAIFKFGLALVTVLSIGSVQALPISGEIQFVASGSFVDADNNVTTSASDATGVDFDPNFGAVGSFGILPTLDIYDMMVAGGITFFPTPYLLALNDFNLIDAPITQWEIAPVVVGGNAGTLMFEILSGGVTDAGSDGSFDLGGQGMFSFTCDDEAACVDGPTALDASIHAFEDTIGSWSISNTEFGDLVVGINVPAPATIGILGAALLGLGVIRRRKTS